MPLTVLVFAVWLGWRFLRIGRQEEEVKGKGEWAGVEGLKG